MNKRIKKKHKKGSLSVFNKSDKLFIKKYPRLYAICSTLNINKQTIDRLYKRIKQYKYLCLDEFQTSIRMILAYISSNQNLHPYCRVWQDFYEYEHMGIAFLDNTGNIKIGLSRW